MNADEEKRSVKRREAAANARAIAILTEAHTQLMRLQSDMTIRPYWGPAQKAAEKVEALIIEMGKG